MCSTGFLRRELVCAFCFRILRWLLIEGASTHHRRNNSVVDRFHLDEVRLEASKLFRFLGQDGFMVTNVVTA